MLNNVNKVCSWCEKWFLQIIEIINSFVAAYNSQYLLPFPGRNQLPFELTACNRNFFTKQTTKAPSQSPQCTPCAVRSLKACKDSRIRNLIIGGDICQIHGPATSSPPPPPSSLPGQRTSITHWTDRWAGATVSLNVLEKTKFVTRADSRPVLPGE